MTWLTELPASLVYVVAAALIFAETGLLVGLVLPGGELVLLLVGFLASLGTVNPYVAAVVLIVAALAGDAVGFREGVRYGPRLRSSRVGTWVGEERWHRAATLFYRHGGRAVFFGRFVAFARTLMPRLVAMGGGPYRRFLAWDALGITTQVVASVAVG